MTDKKLYTIITENQKVTARFTEAELENIRRQYHGALTIVEHVDFNDLVDELNGSVK